MTNESYIVALLEEMNGKFDLMMEMMITMNDSLEKKADKDDVDILISEIRINRFAIKETNRELRGTDFKSLS